MPKETPSNQSSGIRLALVISDLSSGGTQRVLISLASHWLSRGIKVSVLTQSFAECDFFKLPDGATRKALGGLGRSRTSFGRIISNMQRIVKLRRAIRSSSANVVVAFLGQTNITTILACWGLPVKVVACERNDPARQHLGQPWNFLRRWIYPRADIVTANSQAAIDTMSAYVPRQKLRLTPNAILPNPIISSRSHLTPTYSPQFITVGRLNRQKGYDILIKALAMLPDDLAHWHLTILGNGPLFSPMQTLAKEQMVMSRIHWAGIQEDPYPYYRDGDIFVLASRHEGMPNAVLEAVNMGLPAIITDACAGALDIIKNDLSGIVVPSENPGALAAAMARLARDADLRMRYSKAATCQLNDLQPGKVMAIWDKIVRLPDDDQN